jgi:hypothetical protein
MGRLSNAELASCLHASRSKAIFVPHQPHPGADSNQCHENAEAYVRERPGCTLIRGWLIEDFAGWNHFLAHTVVQGADGSWIDPTPMRGSYRSFAMTVAKKILHSRG